MCAVPHARLERLPHPPPKRQSAHHRALHRARVRALPSLLPSQSFSSVKVRHATRFALAADSARPSLRVPPRADTRPRPVTLRTSAGLRLPVRKRREPFTKLAARTRRSGSRRAVADPDLEASALGRDGRIVGGMSSAYGWRPPSLVQPINLESQSARFCLPWDRPRQRDRFPFCLMANRRCLMERAPSVPGAGHKRRQARAPFHSTPRARDRPPIAHPHTNSQIAIGHAAASLPLSIHSPRGRSRQEWRTMPLRTRSIPSPTGP